MWACVHSTLRAGTSSGADPCRLRASYHRLCELIRASVLICLEGFVRCSLGALHPYGAYNFSASSSTGFSDLQGEGNEWDVPFTFQDLLVSAPCPALCLCFCILKKDASLMIAERDTDLWVQQIGIRDCLLLHSFSRTVLFSFLPSPSLIQFQALGEPSRVGYAFYCEP